MIVVAKKEGGLVNMKDVITLRLPSELKEELATEAQNYGFSLNEYISILIHKARRCQL